MPISPPLGRALRMEEPVRIQCMLTGLVCKPRCRLHGAVFGRDSPDDAPFAVQAQRLSRTRFYENSRQTVHEVVARHFNVLDNCLRLPMRRSPTYSDGPALIILYIVAVLGARKRRQVKSSGPAADMTGGCA